MRRLLGTAAISLLVLGPLALRHAGTALVVRDPLPERADAIVMLAGSPPDRVLEAADLYGAGVAPRVVLTRERARPEIAELARRGVVLPDAADVAADALVGLGVPRTALLTLAPRTDSTVAEATIVADWACRSGVRALVVVTSASHTRRVRAVFRRALGEAIEVAVQPARPAGFPGDAWWRHRFAAKLVAMEWQKLASYWLVERWGLRPCATSDLSRPPPS